MAEKFGVTTTLSLIQEAKNIARLTAVQGGEIKQATDHFFQIAAIQDQVQVLLEKFNQGVEGSFHAGGVQGMLSLTTPEGYKRMEGKYQNWRSRQVKELNLVSCDFLSFELKPENGQPIESADSAVVFTFERWVFVYEDGSQFRTIGSVDLYELRRDSSGWKVDSVVTLAREG